MRARRWHLASKNDGLFIINVKPSPSNDHPNHERPEPSVVLNVSSLSEEAAQAIVDAHNNEGVVVDEAMVYRAAYAGTSAGFFHSSADKRYWVDKAVAMLEAALSKKDGAT